MIKDNSAVDKEDITLSSQPSLSPTRLSSINPQNPSPADMTAPDTQTWQSAVGLGLGISSTSSAISASLQQQPLENVPVRKGRFSVNHQSAPASMRTPSLSTDLKNDLTPIPLPELPPSVPMSRGVSNDSMKGGKDHL